MPRQHACPPAPPPGRRYGRVAFSCSAEQLGEVQEEVQARGHTVLTPRVKLDTPGKASVEVVILADPDEHEVRHAAPC